MIGNIIVIGIIAMVCFLFSWGVYDFNDWVKNDPVFNAVITGHVGDVKASGWGAGTAGYCTGYVEGQPNIKYLIEGKYSSACPYDVGDKVKVKQWTNKMVLWDD